MKKGNIAKQYAQGLGYDVVYYVTSDSNGETYTCTSTDAINNKMKTGTPIFYTVKTDNSIVRISDFDIEVKLRRIFFTSPLCKV